MVYNLIGRDYTTKNFDFTDVHVDGAHRIATAVAKYDVDRFVHLSSHSALESSPSEFYRTKAIGERVVRDVFPETTIVRPAPMYGFEDRLLHRLAGRGSVISSNWLQERCAPVHVIDVGAALEKMLYDDNTAGQTYELFGPHMYSMHAIRDLVEKEILKKRGHVNVPRMIMEPFCLALNKYFWWVTRDKDQVIREFVDQYIDPKAKTFDDLDMKAGRLEDFTFKYLVSRLFLSFNKCMRTVLMMV